METFRTRTYDRRELAQMYFPSATPRTAVDHLKRWITHCPELLAELDHQGYQPRSRVLTRRMVETIVRYLGEP
jgi:hypothetical protein